VDVRAVNGTQRLPAEGAALPDHGVEHGGKLLAFTEAVMREDDAAIGRTRAALRAVLGPESFVDVCATIGAFNVVDRIADATGIPLDDMMAAMSVDLRQELDLGRFASAANTPGAR
jgi:hypothetical protein